MNALVGVVAALAAVVAVSRSAVPGAGALFGSPMALRSRRGSGGGHAGGARWAIRHDLRQLAVARPTMGRVTVGRSRGRLVAVEAGHSLLVVGPTQSHKTTGLAIPAVLEWQGPVLAVSVKADLARHTIEWRRQLGEVSLYDPTRSTGLCTVDWSPIDAAGSWADARRVAHRLVEAARPTAGAVTDGDFWLATTAKLLGPMLRAAAVSGRTMADVVRWVDEQDEIEPADALFGAGEHAALQALRASGQRDDRQRSAVYTTTETVVDVFAELPPPSGRPLVARSFLDGRNCLYLCAPAHEQRRLRPLFTALCAEVLDLAFAAGATAPLDPPLLVVVDEAANVAPLPELDALASTAAGHGIQLVTVWQDLAQLTARYGTKAGSVVNNHRAKVFLSGIADPATLEHVSVLVGETEQRHHSVTVDGRGGRSATAVPVVRRLLPPDEIRRLAPGTGVLVSGHRPPARITLRPWWRDRELRRRATTAVVPVDPPDLVHPPVES